MKKKSVYGGVIPDFQDEFGNWRKGLHKNYIDYKTLSGIRWNSINSRCLVGGSIQKSKPSYIGAINKFANFNDFVEWSRNQIGYSTPNFELDKDLLFRGNKIYDKSRCLFIPAKINSLITKSNSIRGKFPIGVHKSKGGKFHAQCSNGQDDTHYLGLYNTPEEAFQAYKVYKEALIKEVAEEYKDVIDIRAYNALMSYTVEIDD